MRRSSDRNLLPLDRPPSVKSRFTAMRAALCAATLLAWPIEAAKAAAGEILPHKAGTKTLGCSAGQACKTQLRNHRMANLGASCLSMEGGTLVYFMFNSAPAHHSVRPGDVIDVDGPACAGEAGTADLLGQPHRIMATRSYNFFNAAGAPITVVFGRDAAERYHAANAPASTIPASTANYYLMYGLYPYGLN